jgi:hypothetical protein
MQFKSVLPSLKCQSQESSPERRATPVKINMFNQESEGSNPWYYKVL